MSIETQWFFSSLSNPILSTIVSGIANDQIIESIESTDHDWCIGVQWHPEFLITKTDKLLVSDFIKTAKKQL